MICPIPRDKKTKNQCRNCEYRDTCLEDILNDLQRLIMKETGETIKKIRSVIKEHEDGTGKLGG